MNLPTKFHRNRHCINGALDRTDIHTDRQTDRQIERQRDRQTETDKQTDRHIDGNTDNKGRKKKSQIFFFD